MQLQIDDQNTKLAINELQIMKYESSKIRSDNKFKVKIKCDKKYDNILLIIRKSTLDDKILVYPFAEL